jgi:chromatin remodeling complex protein RSC6
MKRDIDVEFVNLENIINGLDLTQKAKKTLFKQVGIIRKCCKPKRSNKARNANQNSGLQKAVNISEDMAKFAGWVASELHSRVEVTKAICSYIKTNNLQKPENRRIVLLDARLKNLLAYNEDEITYPHIQKYIGVHLIKPVSEEKPDEKKPKTKKSAKKPNQQ